jgi:hypothetical protein
MLKKLGIGIVVIVLIAVGVGWYLFSNLDSFVKSAIEKYGSEATQASVSVSSVKIALSTGEGSISGLKVGNPKGFSSATALGLESISVKIDTGTIRGNGPIVIKDIEVNQPHVTYEQGAGGNNLQAIQKNAMAYAGTGHSDSGPARKEIIDNLYVRDGQVTISAPALQGKQLTVPLPTIHLTNIGKNSGGATPAEIASQVMAAVSSEAAKVGTNALAQQVESAVTGAVQGGASGAGDIGGQLKGLFGK